MDYKFVYLDSNSGFEYYTQSSSGLLRWRTKFDTTFGVYNLVTLCVL